MVNKSHSQATANANMWKLTIGIEEHYISWEDKELYLEAARNKKSTVKLSDGRIFNTNCQSLVSVQSILDNQRIEEGQWQCEHGEWQKEGGHFGFCFCLEKLKKLSSGIIETNKIWICKKNGILISSPQKNEDVYINLSNSEFGIASYFFELSAQNGASAIEIMPDIVLGTTGKAGDIETITLTRENLIKAIKEKSFEYAKREITDGVSREFHIFPLACAEITYHKEDLPQPQVRQLESVKKKELRA